MTQQEWIELEIGDVIVDLKCGGAKRRVFSVSRVSGKKGQRGNTRVMIHVPNLKSTGSLTILCNAEDIGGKRFRLFSKGTT